MGILADRIRVKATTFTGDMAPMEGSVISSPKMEELQEKYDTGAEMVKEESRKMLLSEFLAKLGIGIEEQNKRKSREGYSLAIYPDGHKAIRLPKGESVDDPKIARAIWHEIGHHFDKAKTLGGHGQFSSRIQYGVYSTPNYKILDANKDYILKQRIEPELKITYTINKVKYRGLDEVLAAPELDNSLKNWAKRRDAEHKAKIEWYLQQNIELFAEGFALFMENPAKMKAEAPELYEVFAKAASEHPEIADAGYTVVAKKNPFFDHVIGKELKHGLTRDGKRYGVSIGKDKDGYFCYTHRARSKSYPTIADIPKSALKFIDSTGMKKVFASRYENRTVDIDGAKYSVVLRWSDHPYGMSAKPIPLTTRQADIIVTVVTSEEDAMQEAEAEIMRDRQKAHLSPEEKRHLEEIISARKILVDKLVADGASIRSAKRIANEQIDQKEEVMAYNRLREYKYHFERKSGEKVEGKAEVYLGESGLDKSWQAEFPADAKCCRCGGDARIAYVLKENDPDIAALHDFNRDGADGGSLWLHDAGAFATYLCEKCLEPTTLYNQAMKAVASSDAEYLAAVDRNDMATAQSMVDAAAKAAGYTVGPVYHGTNSKFNVFKPQFGKAIWFSEDREKIARGDSGASGTQRIVPVFLKATNPAGWKEYDKLLEMQIISNGFDSVHLDDDWIVYSPSQIKSAEPVVYNNFGKVVPLSKRFNSSSNDIRAMRVEASGSPSYLPTIEQTLEYMDSSHEGAYYDLYPAYSEPVVDGEDDYAYDTKEKAYQQAEFILDILGGLPDPVDAWRAIYAKDVDSIRKDWLGESWSFEKEAALEFGSHARANFLLHAKIPRSAIDWDRTVREFTQNSSDPSSGESEFEVVVDDFDKIHDLEIYQIKGMKKVARRNMTATTTKKYQVTYADGTCAFRDMTPNHAESMRDRDGVAAVALMDLPDKKVEAGNKNKGEYDLWGSIEKAVERGLLAYVGFMAADYLHQKKNASFGLENYRPVIDAYGEIGHSNKLTDDDKSMILKRLNDAGWDASDEGIEFLWGEILRHRKATS